MATAPSLKALAEAKADGIQKATTFKVDPHAVHEEPGFNLRSEGPELDAYVDQLEAAQQALEALEQQLCRPAYDWARALDIIAKCKDELESLRSALAQQGAQEAFKLPHDVVVCGNTFRKGVKLGTFIAAAQSWHRAAYPGAYELTQEQKAANFARLTNGVRRECHTCEHSDSFGLPDCVMPASCGESKSHWKPLNPHLFAATPSTLQPDARKVIEQMVGALENVPFLCESDRVVLQAGQQWLEENK